MGKTESQTARAELQAFHHALVRIMKETNRQGEIIPLADWQRMVVLALGTMTRQSCNDKTWAMEAMGLIERKAREGVIVLADAPVDIPSNG